MAVFAPLLILFWVAYALNAYLRATLTDTRDRTQVPFLLNGLQVRLDRCLEPPVPAISDGRLQLLILCSDHCRYSWEDLASQRRSCGDTRGTDDFPR